MNIAEVLEKRVKENQGKAAVVFNDQQISFSQLRDSSYKLAQGLFELGIKKGDKVALYLPGCPEYIISYLAIWLIGAVAVPLDFMLTEDELISCITHSEAKLAIIKHKANLPLENIKKSCPELKDIITYRDKIEDCLNFEDYISGKQGILPKVSIEDRDYSIIFYTSGTTGKPKGVLVNYEQLSAPPRSMAFFVNSDMTSKDTTLCALPFSHLGGLIYIQNLISFGYTLVLMERFIPLEFLKNIQNHKVNFFWIVPSMYYALLQLKEFESFDLSSLRWIVTFGASSSPDALRRFHQYCPKAHLLNGWGMTETNAPTVVLPFASEKIESVGRPVPWAEVRIHDDEGKDLPPGKTGEVVVKGWIVTDGYFKDPELTKESFRNNWFLTGDLGRFDAEGFLYIVGRKKEMIKVGGEIVFEPEVESVIYKHPDVAEAAVIGISDKLRGEVPKAFIVAKQGKLLKEEDMRYFLREHLAHFKIPHYFEFVSALPKNRTGKINKELLRPR